MNNWYMGDMLTTAMLVESLISIGLGIAGYVLTGISLYQIGKRRRIRNYGLAWVPIGNLWVINAIGDQYQEIRTGQRQYLRRWAMGLIGGFVLLWLLGMVMAFTAVVKAFTYRDTLTPGEIMSLGSSAMLMILAILLMLAAWTAAMVLTYISLYRLYRSTRPQNAVVFLVLSIVISVTAPFFLFACRKYDAPIEMLRSPIPPQPQQLEAPPADAEKPTDEE